MRSDAERSAAYDAKTQAATVALIVAAVLPDARTNFADPQGMSDLVSKEAQVQGLLNGKTPAVPTIYYPFYLAFARELWKATRTGIAGAALVNAAQGIRDKWNYKGFLTATILDDIALTVFNVVTS
jgi:integral membrane sensor domain MASE1